MLFYKLYIFTKTLDF